MLSTVDLERPDLQSGYAHVNSARGSKSKTDSWRASRGAGYPGRPKWRGPIRKDPRAAAQDYCDLINSGAAGTPATPTLKSAGHNGKRKPIRRDEEVEYALGVLRDARGERDGKQGYVYLIIEVNPGGGLHYGKVGFSTNPQARVAELQTGNPRPLALHCITKGTVEDEAALHAKYIAENVLQEWFHITKDLLLEFDLDANGQPWGARTGRVSCAVPSGAPARKDAV